MTNFSQSIKSELIRTQSSRLFVGTKIMKLASKFGKGLM
ncbi:hypothetical protein JCM19238_637 [Vibrio ponticus]|nr:hypothetical protein JCM19238_637 [Vibrio ponticus]